MAELFIDERFDSRARVESAAGGSAVLLFTVGGTDDEEEALNFGLPRTPISFRALLRQKSTIKRKGIELWDLDIDYGVQTASQSQRPFEVGEVRFNWDTVGGTLHITHSRETTGSFAPAGETACDFQGAIGVSGDSIEGVDIPAPALKFSLTYRAPKSLINIDYVKKIRDLTTTTNERPFFTFEEASLLFLGGTGDETFGDSSIATFSFQAIPNEANIAVGPNITVTEKLGHEYLWAAYADAEDAVCKRTVKRPISAYTERVFIVSDFADLKIGT